MQLSSVGNYLSSPSIPHKPQKYNHTHPVHLPTMSPSPEQEHMMLKTSSHVPSHPPTVSQPECGQEQHSSPTSIHSSHKTNPNKCVALQEPANPPLHKKNPPYLNSQASTRTWAKAHDYEHIVCQLIIEACWEYEVRVITNEPLPDPEQALVWACECWSHACEEFNANYSLPDHIISIIMFICQPHLSLLMSLSAR